MIDSYENTKGIRNPGVNREEGERNKKKGKTSTNSKTLSSHRKTTFRVKSEPQLTNSIISSVRPLDAQITADRDYSQEDFELDLDNSVLVVVEGYLTSSELAWVVAQEKRLF